LSGPGPGPEWDKTGGRIATDPHERADRPLGGQAPDGTAGLRLGMTVSGLGPGPGPDTVPLPTHAGHILARGR